MRYRKAPVFCTGRGRSSPAYRKCRVSRTDAAKSWQCVAVSGFICNLATLMTPELMKKYIALLFAMAILPFAAIAQQIIDLPQLDQLPIHSIHRIFQDSEGYVWYGTSDGLCRDDGYKVQVFRSDLHTPDLMQSNLIYSIAEDSNNRLWFGTDRGVYILDKATYSISRLDRPEINGIKVSCVGSTSDGDIWIGVPGGLCRFSPDGELKTRYTIDKGQGRINSFYEDFDQRIWICVEGEGLCRLEPETGALESFSRAGEADESYIIQDKSRKYYWVGSWGEGIHRFDPDAAPGKRYTPQPAAFSRQSRHDNCIINMTQDDVDGRLWVITYNNLEAYRISAQGMLEPVDTSPYLPEGNKMLSYVIKDRDRNLWVAAYDRDSFIINLQDSHITEYQMQEMRKHLNVNLSYRSARMTKKAFSGSPRTGTGYIFIRHRPGNSCLSATARG